MGQFGMIDTVVLILYFLIIIGISYHAYRITENFDDFSVGGRTIPTSLLFETIGATLIGGATIGRVAYVNTTGIVIVLAILGVVLNQILSGLFIAPQAREMGNKVYGYRRYHGLLLR